MVTTSIVPLMAKRTRKSASVVSFAMESRSSGLFPLRTTRLSAPVLRLPVRNRSDLPDVRREHQLRAGVVMNDLNYLIGMAEDEAMQAVSVAGLGVRIAMRDGKARVLTRDYRSDRVNLTVTDGVVTEAHIG